MNQIRSLLFERGVIAPQAKPRLAAALTNLLDGAVNIMAPRMLPLMMDLRDRWRALDQRISAFDAEFAKARFGPILFCKHRLIWGAVREFPVAAERPQPTHWNVPLRQAEPGELRDAVRNVILAEMR